MGVIHANRGRAFEELIEMANAAYRARGLAVIHKVPTEWVPLRGGRGEIVSAKVTRKAAVDFIGHVLLPSGHALPVAFDAKEVSKGCRWPLSKLEEHQYGYLADCSRTGACAFVLIAFWEPGRFFVLPFSELARHRAARESGGGPASVRAGENGLVEVWFSGYLDFLLQERGESYVPRKSG